MKTRIVRLSDGTEIWLREMTVGEIRSQTPDIDLIYGMVDAGCHKALDRLPASEFSEIVRAVADLTAAREDGQP